MLKEKHARVIIVIAAALAMVGLAVFIGDTRLFTAIANQPQPDDILAPSVQIINSQQEQLDLQLAENQELLAELEKMQKRLDEAQTEAEIIAGQNIMLTDDFVMEYAGEFKATAYCCEEYKHICGGNGVTASGTKPTPGLTCAADWTVFTPGTWLYIEDVGIRRVEDSGSAIKGNKLDIAIDTHENALRWKGFGMHRVWVLGYGTTKGN